MVVKGLLFYLFWIQLQYDVLVIILLTQSKAWQMLTIVMLVSKIEK